MLFAQRSLALLLIIPFKEIKTNNVVDRIIRIVAWGASRRVDVIADGFKSALHGPHPLPIALLISSWPPTVFGRSPLELSTHRMVEELGW